MNCGSLWRGQAANVAICLALLPLLVLNPVSVADFTHPFASLGGLVVKLFVANFMLAAFNMLPAFPMDGGRVMRALLAARGDFVWATRIAARSGQVFAAAFAIIGLFFAPFLLLIAAFLFFAAESAYQGACYRAALAGWRVGDLMRHDVATVSPTTSVADAAALSLRAGQDALPIVDGDRVLGLVDREAFAKARAEGASGDPVISRAVMGFRTLQPSNGLLEIVEEMNRCGRASLPVMDGGRLVGMISLSAISDLRTLPFKSGRRGGFPAREATA